MHAGGCFCLPNGNTFHSRLTFPEVVSDAPYPRGSTACPSGPPGEPREGATIFASVRQVAKRNLKRFSAVSSDSIGRGNSRRPTTMPLEKVALVGSGNWGSAIATKIGLNVLANDMFDKGAPPRP